MKRGLAGSIRIAESGSASDHGLSTDYDEEMDRLGREKAELRSSLATIGAWDGFKEGAVQHG